MNIGSLFNVIHRRKVMKRFATLVALSLALVSSIAFAATPVAEPMLPTDIEKWEKVISDTCRKNPGKTISMEVYRKTREDGESIIQTFSLNGKKVAQLEASDSADGFTVISYAKNSPQNNWLKYGKDESGEMKARFLNEVGLTETQLASCGNN